MKKNPRSQVIACTIYNKHQTLRQIALDACASILTYRNPVR